MNAIKEEVEFKGLRKQGGIDIRSVPSKVIDTIEDLDIPETQSLLAPTKSVEETPPEPSLLGKM